MARRCKRATFSNRVADSQQVRTRSTRSQCRRGLDQCVVSCRHEEAVCRARVGQGGASAPLAPTRRPPRLCGRHMQQSVQSLISTLHIHHVTLHRDNHSQLRLTRWTTLVACSVCDTCPHTHTLARFLSFLLDESETEIRIVVIKPAVLTCLRALHTEKKRDSNE
jgi:hypothetical protein